jgi:ketosteroid isomerase-like protein
MSRENFEAVRRLVDAFNARDADAACAVLNDDAEWRPAYTGGGAVEGAVYRGHAGFRRYLDDLAETWREIEGYIDELREVGESVLLFARIRFVGRQSGVEMTQPITGVFRFCGDKIAVARYYVERREALEAVGRGGVGRLELG